MNLRRTGVRVTAGITLVAVAALLWFRLGPVDPKLLDRGRFESVTIVDRNGELLYEPLAASGSRGTRLTADALPPRVVDAVVAAEDRRFFLHPGVDPLAVSRALLHNVRAMRVVEGGSTISQQVAKLLLGSTERTLGAKWRESVLALRLEHRLSKREILALYCNLAPYGNRITGLARASRVYFGVGPEALTPAQAAFLAALPQRPSAYNPIRNPQAARARQLHILAAMRLSPGERERAAAEALRFARESRPVEAMHFVERVLDRSRSSRRERSGTIRTTLDLALQRQVSGIIEMNRDVLQRHGARSVAVAVLDNRSGEWLAWEGSGDYFGTSFGGAIDGVVTLRQPGSTLKPFTYALAFESGQTPASVVADVPSHFATAEPGVVYTPRNYDGRYRGPMLIRSALAGSENVPAVATLAKLGPETLLRLLRGIGFDTLDRTADHYGVGLTLGDAEVTLEQLVTAYAAFARGGVSVEPAMIASDRSRPARRLVGERTAFWVTDILSDAVAREYAFGSGGSLDFPFPVAVKTGTSQAYRDNWTVGYTRDVTVGVWVGNFDRSELHGSSGITGAAPIFNAVMLAAMKRARGTLPVGDATPVLEAVAGVESIAICTLSGARPSPWCPATRREWLPREAAPQFCAWHHDGWIDWPAEYRAWAREAFSEEARKPAALTTRHETPLRITNPADGATYMIDPTLRMEFQTLRLRAEATSRVSWTVGGRRIGSAAPGSSVEWPLVPGRHTVRAVDARGVRDEVQIFVK